MRLTLLAPDIVEAVLDGSEPDGLSLEQLRRPIPVSYTHLRAHETVLDLVCRLLLEKKNSTTLNTTHHII